MFCDNRHCAYVYYEHNWEVESMSFVVGDQVSYKNIEWEIHTEVKHLNEINN